MPNKKVPLHFFEEYEYLSQNICFSHKTQCIFSSKRPVALITCGGTTELH